MLIGFLFFLCSVQLAWLAYELHLSKQQCRLLRWFVRQFEGDSGTGASYWMQRREFVEAKATIGEPLDQDMIDEMSEAD